MENRRNYQKTPRTPMLEMRSGAPYASFPGALPPGNPAPLP